MQASMSKVVLPLDGRDDEGVQHSTEMDQIGSSYRDESQLSSHIDDDFIEDVIVQCFGITSPSVAQNEHQPSPPPRVPRVDVPPEQELSKPAEPNLVSIDRFGSAIYSNWDETEPDYNYYNPHYGQEVIVPYQEVGSDKEPSERLTASNPGYSLDVPFDETLNPLTSTSNPNALQEEFFDDMDLNPAGLKDVKFYEPQTNELGSENSSETVSPGCSSIHIVPISDGMAEVEPQSPPEELVGPVALPVVGKNVIVEKNPAASPDVARVPCSSSICQPLSSPPSYRETMAAAYPKAGLDSLSCWGPNGSVVKNKIVLSFSGEGVSETDSRDSLDNGPPTLVRMDYGQSPTNVQPSDNMPMLEPADPNLLSSEKVAVHVIPSAAGESLEPPKNTLDAVPENVPERHEPGSQEELNECLGKLVPSITADFLLSGVQNIIPQSSCGDDVGSLPDLLPVTDEPKLHSTLDRSNEKKKKKKKHEVTVINDEVLSMKPTAPQPRGPTTANITKKEPLTTSTSLEKVTTTARLVKVVRDMKGKPNFTIIPTTSNNVGEKKIMIVKPQNMQDKTGLLKSAKFKMFISDVETVTTLKPVPMLNNFDCGKLKLVQTPVNPKCAKERPEALPSSNPTSKELKDDASSSTVKGTPALASVSLPVSLELNKIKISEKLLPAKLKTVLPVAKKVEPSTNDEPIEKAVRDDGDVDQNVVEEAMGVKVSFLFPVTRSDVKPSKVEQPLLVHVPKKTPPPVVAKMTTKAASKSFYPIEDVDSSPEKLKTPSPVKPNESLTRKNNNVKIVVKGEVQNPQRSTQSHSNGHIPSKNEVSKEKRVEAVIESLIEKQKRVNDSGNVNREPSLMKPVKNAKEDLTFFLSSFARPGERREDIENLDKAKSTQVFQDEPVTPTKSDLALDPIISPPSRIRNDDPLCLKKDLENLELNKKRASQNASLISCRGFVPTAPSDSRRALPTGRKVFEFPSVLSTQNVAPPPKCPSVRTEDTQIEAEGKVHPLVVLVNQVIEETNSKSPHIFSEQEKQRAEDVQTSLEEPEATQPEAARPHTSDAILKDEGNRAKEDGILAGVVKERTSKLIQNARALVLSGSTDNSPSTDVSTGLMKAASHETASKMVRKPDDLSSTLKDLKDNQPKCSENFQNVDKPQISTSPSSSHRVIAPAQDEVVPDKATSNPFGNKTGALGNDYKVAESAVPRDKIRKENESPLPIADKNLSGLKPSVLKQPASGTLPCKLILAEAESPKEEVTKELKGRKTIDSKLSSETTGKPQERHNSTPKSKLPSKTSSIPEVEGGKGNMNLEQPQLINPIPLDSPAVADKISVESELKKGKDDVSVEVPGSSKSSPADGDKPLKQQKMLASGAGNVVSLPVEAEGSRETPKNESEASPKEVGLENPITNTRKPNEQPSSSQSPNQLPVKNNVAICQKTAEKIARSTNKNSQKSEALSKEASLGKVLNPPASGSPASSGKILCESNTVKVEELKATPKPRQSLKKTRSETEPPKLPTTSESPENQKEKSENNVLDSSKKAVHHTENSKMLPTLPPALEVSNSKIIPLVPLPVGGNPENTLSDEKKAAHSPLIGDQRPKGLSNEDPKTRPRKDSSVKLSAVATEPLNKNPSSLKDSNDAPAVKNKPNKATAATTLSVATRRKSRGADSLEGKDAVMTDTNTVDKVPSPEMTSRVEEKVSTPLSNPPAEPEKEKSELPEGTTGSAASNSVEKSVRAQKIPEKAGHRMRTRGSASAADSSLKDDGKVEQGKEVGATIESPTSPGDALNQPPCPPSVSLNEKTSNRPRTRSETCTDKKPLDEALDAGGDGLSTCTPPAVGEPEISISNPCPDPLPPVAAPKLDTSVTDQVASQKHDQGVRTRGRILRKPVPVKLIPATPKKGFAKSRSSRCEDFLSEDELKLNDDSVIASGETIANSKESVGPDGAEFEAKVTASLPKRRTSLHDACPLPNSEQNVCESTRVKAQSIARKSTPNRAGLYRDPKRTLSKSKSKSRRSPMKPKKVSKLRNDAKNQMNDPYDFTSDDDDQPKIQTIDHYRKVNTQNSISRFSSPLSSVLTDDENVGINHSRVNPKDASKVITGKMKRRSSPRKSTSEPTKSECMKATLLKNSTSESTGNLLGSSSETAMTAELRENRRNSRNESIRLAKLKRLKHSSTRKLIAVKTEETKSFKPSSTRGTRRSSSSKILVDNNKADDEREKVPDEVDSLVGSNDECKTTPGISTRETRRSSGSVSIDGQANKKEPERIAMKLVADKTRKRSPLKKEPCAADQGNRASRNKGSLGDDKIHENSGETVDESKLKTTSNVVNGPSMDSLHPVDHDRDIVRSKLSIIEVERPVTESSSSRMKTRSAGSIASKMAESDLVEDPATKPSQPSNDGAILPKLRSSTNKRLDAHVKPESELKEVPTSTAETNLKSCMITPPKVDGGNEIKTPDKLRKIRKTDSITFSKSKDLLVVGFVSEDATKLIGVATGDSTHRPKRAKKGGVADTVGDLMLSQSPLLSSQDMASRNAEAVSLITPPMDTSASQEPDNIQPVGAMSQHGEPEGAKSSTRTAQLRSLVDPMEDDGRNANPIGSLRKKGKKLVEKKTLPLSPVISNNSVIDGEVITRKINDPLIQSGNKVSSVNCLPVEYERLRTHVDIVPKSFPPSDNSYVPKAGSSHLPRKLSDEVHFNEETKSTRRITRSSLSSSRSDSDVKTLSNESEEEHVHESISSSSTSSPVLSRIGSAMCSSENQNPIFPNRDAPVSKEGSYHTVKDLTVTDVLGSPASDKPIRDAVLEKVHDEVAPVSRPTRGRKSQDTLKYAQVGKGEIEFAPPKYLAAAKTKDSGFPSAAKLPVPGKTMVEGNLKATKKDVLPKSSCYGVLPKVNRIKATTKDVCEISGEAKKLYDEASLDGREGFDVIVPSPGKSPDSTTTHSSEIVIPGEDSPQIDNLPLAKISEDAHGVTSTTEFESIPIETESKLIISNETETNKSTKKEDESVSSTTIDSTKPIETIEVGSSSDEAFHLKEDPSPLKPITIIGERVSSLKTPGKGLSSDESLKVSPECDLKHPKKIWRANPVITVMTATTETTAKVAVGSSENEVSRALKPSISSEECKRTPLKPLKKRHVYSMGQSQNDDKIVSVNSHIETTPDNSKVSPNVESSNTTVEKGTCHNPNTVVCGEKLDETCSTSTSVDALSHSVRRILAASTDKTIPSKSEDCVAAEGRADPTEANSGPPNAQAWGPESVSEVTEVIDCAAKSVEGSTEPNNKAIHFESRVDEDNKGEMVSHGTESKFTMKRSTKKKPQAGVPWKAIKNPEEPGSQQLVIARSRKPSKVVRKVGMSPEKLKSIGSLESSDGTVVGVGNINVSSRDQVVTSIQEEERLEGAHLDYKNNDCGRTDCDLSNNPSAKKIAPPVSLPEPCVISEPPKLSEALASPPTGELVIDTTDEEESPPYSPIRNNERSEQANSNPDSLSVKTNFPSCRPIGAFQTTPSIVQQSASRKSHERVRSYSNDETDRSDLSQKARMRRKSHPIENFPVDLSNHEKLITMEIPANTPKLDLTGKTPRYLMNTGIIENEQKRTTLVRQLPTPPPHPHHPHYPTHLPLVVTPLHPFHTFAAPIVSPLPPKDEKSIRLSSRINATSAFQPAKKNSSSAFTECRKVDYSNHLLLSNRSGGSILLDSTRVPAKNMARLSITPGDPSMSRSPVCPNAILARDFSPSELEHRHAKSFGQSDISRGSTRVSCIVDTLDGERSPMVDEIEPLNVVSCELGEEPNTSVLKGENLKSALPLEGKKTAVTPIRTALSNAGEGARNMELPNEDCTSEDNESKKDGAKTKRATASRKRVSILDSCKSNKKNSTSSSGSFSESFSLDLSNEIPPEGPAESKLTRRVETHAIEPSRDSDHKTLEKLSDNATETGRSVDEVLDASKLPNDVGLKLAIQDSTLSVVPSEKVSSKQSDSRKGKEVDVLSLSHSLQNGNGTQTETPTSELSPPGKAKVESSEKMEMTGGSESIEPHSEKPVKQPIEEVKDCPSVEKRQGKEVEGPETGGEPLKNIQEKNSEYQGTVETGTDSRPLAQSSFDSPKQKVEGIRTWNTEIEAEIDLGTKVPSSITEVNVEAMVNMIVETKSEAKTNGKPCLVSPPVLSNNSESNSGVKSIASKAASLQKHLESLRLEKAAAEVKGAVIPEVLSTKPDGIEMEITDLGTEEAARNKIVEAVDVTNSPTSCSGVNSTTESAETPKITEIVPTKTVVVEPETPPVPATDIESTDGAVKDQVVSKMSLSSTGEEHVTNVSCQSPQISKPPEDPVGNVDNDQPPQFSVNAAALPPPANEDDSHEQPIDDATKTKTELCVGDGGGAKSESEITVGVETSPEGNPSTNEAELDDHTRRQQKKKEESITITRGFEDKSISNGSEDNIIISNGAEDNIIPNGSEDNIISCGSEDIISNPCADKENIASNECDNEERKECTSSATTPTQIEQKEVEQLEQRKKEKVPTNLVEGEDRPPADSLKEAGQVDQPVGAGESVKRNEVRIITGNAINEEVSTRPEAGEQSKIKNSNVSEALPNVVTPSENTNSLPDSHSKPSKSVESHAESTQSQCPQSISPPTESSVVCSESTVARSSPVPPVVKSEDPSEENDPGNHCMDEEQLTATKHSDEMNALVSTPTAAPHGQNVGSSSGEQESLVLSDTGSKTGKEKETAPLNPAPGEEKQVDPSTPIDKGNPSESCPTISPSIQEVNEKASPVGTQSTLAGSPKCDPAQNPTDSSNPSHSTHQTIDGTSSDTTLIQNTKDGESANIKKSSDAEKTVPKSTSETCAIVISASSSLVVQSTALTNNNEEIRESVKSTAPPRSERIRKRPCRWSLEEGISASKLPKNTGMVSASNPFEVECPGDPGNVLRIDPSLPRVEVEFLCQSVARKLQESLGISIHQVDMVKLERYWAEFHGSHSRDVIIAKAEHGGMNRSQEATDKPQAEAEASPASDIQTMPSTSRSCNYNAVEPLRKARDTVSGRLNDILSERDRFAKMSRTEIPKRAVSKAFLNNVHIYCSPTVQRPSRGESITRTPLSQSPDLPTVASVKRSHQITYSWLVEQLREHRRRSRSRESDVPVEHCNDFIRPREEYIRPSLKEIYRTYMAGAGPMVGYSRLRTDQEVPLAAGSSFPTQSRIPSITISSDSEDSNPGHSEDAVNDRDPTVRRRIRRKSNTSSCPQPSHAPSRTSCSRDRHRARSVASSILSLASPFTSLELSHSEHQETARVRGNAATVGGGDEPVTITDPDFATHIIKTLIANGTSRRDLERDETMAAPRDSLSHYPERVIPAVTLSCAEPPQSSSSAHPPPDTERGPGAMFHRCLQQKPFSEQGRSEDNDRVQGSPWFGREKSSPLPGTSVSLPGNPLYDVSANLEEASDRLGGASNADPQTRHLGLSVPHSSSNSDDPTLPRRRSSEHRSRVASAEEVFRNIVATLNSVPPDMHPEIMQLIHRSTDPPDGPPTKKKKS